MNCVSLWKRHVATCPCKKREVIISLLDILIFDVWTAWIIIDLLSAGCQLLERFLTTLHEVRCMPLPWSEMNLHELAMTCHELVHNTMTVRRVAARSAHNQRVLWSWHLVCSGPALPQQIDRWRLTARPACWGSKTSFVFATSLRNLITLKW